MRKRRRTSKLNEKTSRSKVTTKILVCEKKGCTREVVVDNDTASVICWECVQGMVGIDPKYLQQPSKKVVGAKDTGFPRGWHLYKLFVHPDGRVFELGKENEKLKGTLPATQVKVNTLSKSERRRLREEKKERREARLAKRYKKKMKEKSHV